MTAWWYVAAGIIFTALGDYLMKASQGFTHRWMGITAVLLYLANIVLWGLAIKTLPLGAAYVVWMGLGTVAALSLGMLFFGETLTIAKTAFIAMVVVGCVGLTVIDNVK